MSSAHMLSGYSPPFIDYKPAKAGDASVHQQARDLDSKHFQAVKVTLSPEAQAAMKTQPAPRAPKS
ncbi:MAG: hypothetical protein ACXU8U_00620 [Asticcacaulis sp.]